MWIRSKWFFLKVHSSSASSIWKLTFGGTLYVLDGGKGTEKGEVP